MRVSRPRPVGECLRRAARQALVAMLLTTAAVVAPSFAQPRAATIAFIRETEGHAQLWIMDVDGSDPRQLTSSAVDKHSPSWCPGNRVLRFQTKYGDSVLYELSTGREEYERPSFFVGPVGIDGKTVPSDRLGFRASRNRARDPRRLQCAQERDDGEVVELSLPEGLPAGKVVVFQRAPALDGKLGVEIKVVDVADRAALSTLRSGRTARLNRVLDKGRLAYVVQKDRASEIWSMNADGEAARISQIPGSARNLTWSSDGSALLFDSDHDGVRQIYRLSLDGGALEPLTRGTSPSESPAPSFVGR